MIGSFVAIVAAAVATKDQINYVNFSKCRVDRSHDREK